MEALTHLTKARSNVLLREAFYGKLAMNFNFIHTDKEHFATDGKNIFYTTKFVQKESIATLMGSFVHEVLHCILDHPTRRGNREKNLWNIACDLAINPIVDEAGFLLPAGVLRDAKYTNWTAEAIYNDLLEMGDAMPYKRPTWGLVKDPDPSTAGDAESIEAEWDRVVASAAMEAGSIPKALEKLVQSLLKPKTNWREELWPFFTSISKSDYNWNKPHRAYIGDDEYLPSLGVTAAGKIGIVVDTSESTRNYVDLFWSEICALHNFTAPEKLIVVECDSQVQQVTEYDPDNNLAEHQFKALGGGGTKFSPAFNYLRENHPDLDAVVYLTDLECNDFGQKPGYPVLFVTPSNTYVQEVPFGHCITLPLAA